MQYKRTLRRRSAIGAVAALVASIVAAAPAQAAASCSGPTSGEYTVNVTGTDTVIQKVGTNLAVTGCSAQAVSTVFDVTITGSSGNDTVTFAMEGGLFEEDSQIPFEIAMGSGTDKLVFTGTDEKDEISLGDEGVMLGLHGPPQITWGAFADSGLESVEINAGDGPDLLAANGSRTGDHWPAASTINGELGNDTVIGGDGADAINGGDGSDRLDGGTGNDTMHGDLGNDTVVEGSSANGSDDVFGDGGRDRVDYSRRSGAVRVTVDSGADDGEISPAEADEVNTVEVVMGGDGNDVLTASAAVTTPASAPKAQLVGNDGDDTITGGHGRDSITGNDGNDTINGEPGDSTALAAACSAEVKFCRDIIDGGTGNDTINGGPGNDTIQQGATADGNDVLRGGGDTDTVRYGARTADLEVTMSGSSGSGEGTESDTIHNDVENLQTGRGVDDVTGNDSANKLTLGAGDDEASGGNGADKISGNSGDDTINGNDGDDKLYGGGGKDKLFGNAGSNEIYGGSGFDVCQDFSKKVSCP